jgi:hypothetical protein
MANYYGTPAIVTDGLIFAVDPGNGQSYVSGSTTCTSLVSNIDGTLTNGAVWSSNNQGVFNFDGSDDNIRTTAALSTILPNDIFTLEVWVKAATLDSERDFLIGSLGSGWTSGVGLRIENDLISNSALFWNGTWNTNYAYKAITVTDWNHIVGTYDDATMRVYVNGVEGTSASETGAVTRIYPITIGIGVTADRPLDGQIGQARIYKKSLTSAEVTQNYNSTKNRFI